MRWLERLLSVIYGVKEPTQEDSCILRVSVGRAHQDRRSPDGTRVRRGEPVGELHLWNAHLPQVRETGPDLRWSVAFYHRLLRSFVTVVRYAGATESFDQVRAFHADIALITGSEMDRMRDFLTTLGFEVTIRTCPRGWRGFVSQFALFWQNFYSWMLIWAFNPNTLYGRRLSEITRFDMWASRGALRALYVDTPSANSL